MSGGPPELRGPLFHNVSSFKRELPFWRVSCIRRGPPARRASFLERTSCKYIILQAAITKAKLCSVVRRYKLRHKNIITTRSGSHPEKIFCPGDLLSRGASCPEGPPVQRRPPVQRGSAQGASRPDGPPVQRIPVQRGCPIHREPPAQGSPAQGAFCP